MANTNNPADFDDEMSEYLQTFLDETEEQLDDLVETMLLLENASTNEAGLNEAFRLIHSIKGSAGMMGLDNITVLTHHLENRFERFRSGTQQLDEQTMNLVLRCIDFLRDCVDRLRDDQTLGSPTELLTELKKLEDQAVATKTQPIDAQTDAIAESTDQRDDASTADHKSDDDLNDRVRSSVVAPHAEAGVVRMVVRFRAGLQLVDLKARLIVNRLAGLGELKSLRPALDALSETEKLDQFEIFLETDEDPDRLRAAADVDGVEAIEFPAITTESKQEERAADLDVGKIDQPAHEDQSQSDREPAAPASVSAAALPDATKRGAAETTDLVDPVERVDPVELPSTTSAVAAAPTPQQATAKVAGTMRVDIDRLDNLMNLAGELVVNRARFVQIAGKISPEHRKASSLNQVREFCDGLRQTIDSLTGSTVISDEQQALVGQLRAGLELMDEHTDSWERDRHHLDRFGEAIDQLSRVSQSLQKGVLDTRMVPVGPLFNRFKRVIRDLSKERGNQVNLVIRGEKTELDKRMIDELGDPLVHLVRNSIDHGMESPEVRVECGKPELGTISLEATHSGNNVFIHVRDDGAGIDVDSIKSKLISNRVLSETMAAELTREQALDYIWHPGFSTAQEVSDISGRGVGMDVVLNRVRQLNGSIEIESVPQQGTHFTIRLPLTLAIINCLLVRLRGIVFSMPIDDVREIVSVSEQDVVMVKGKHTIDVRDEFIPLVGIEDVFDWHHDDLGRDAVGNIQPEQIDKTSEVVVLRSGGKAMGLRVDELLGSQEMVIKSLSDNFVNIRGLSGASILGDGSVSLMLDVGTLFHIATQASALGDSQELAR